MPNPLTPMTYSNSNILNTLPSHQLSTFILQNKFQNVFSYTSSPFPPTNPNNLPSHFFFNIHNKPSLLYLYIILPFLQRLLSKPYVIPTSYLFTNIFFQIPHPSHSTIQKISLTSLLLRCGDIEPNPGPCPHLIINLPPDYNTRSSSYFLPKTIKLKPEYQHIAQNFAPHFLNTHPIHPQKTLSHPYLHHFIQTHNSHPSPRIFYTLILAMSLSPDRCELKLQYLPNLPFVQIILTHLSQLPIPPETHLTIPHPFDLFQQANADIMYPSNTIHMQLYDLYTNILGHYPLLT
jgi:hypothetical protein